MNAVMNRCLSVFRVRMFKYATRRSVRVVGVFVCVRVCDSKVSEKSKKVDSWSVEVMLFHID